MSLVASEIVFPLTTSPSINESCVFRYDHGPVKVTAPRRRGRPVNCMSSLQAISSIETNFTLVATRVSASKELSKRPRVANNDFHFIHMAGYNANSISDETRITIRKRVMDNYMHRKRKPVNGPNHIPINLVREIAQVDPFDAFPIKLEPYMLDLLKYYMTTVWKSFYTIESLTSINPMTDYWIPLAFCDDALLHLLIGCADSHNARCMHFEDRPIALRHVNKALSIMKIRIATSVR